MATKYSMDIRGAETGELTPVALFSDLLTTEVLLDLCEAMARNVDGADAILVTDMDTGEIVCDLDLTPDPDWGYNEDMGFDPYMGCYTDDC